MLNTADLLNNIIKNAVHNVELNDHLFLDVEDAASAAKYYLSEHQSIIASNINAVDDKECLEINLEHQLVLTHWMLNVLEHYLMETRRNIELTNEKTFKYTFKPE